MIMILINKLCRYPYYQQALTPEFHGCPRALYSFTDPASWVYYFRQYHGPLFHR